MSGKRDLDDVKACPYFGDVVSIFLSKKYSPVLEEYRSLLQADPDYLSYHGTTTSLRLQFRLKLEDLPSMCIGGCMSEGGEECCIVSALREAIQQRYPQPVRQQTLNL